MHYIVDASVIVENLVVGQFTNNVRAFLRQQKYNDVLVAPEFCLLECTNVLWKRVRFSGMPYQNATNLLTVLRGMLVQYLAMDFFLPKTLEIAVKHNLAVYDSSYIALGLHLNYPLITIDEKQAKIAQAEGVTLIPITNFNL